MIAGGSRGVPVFEGRVLGGVLLLACQRPEAPPPAAVALVCAADQAQAVAVGTDPTAEATAVSLWLRALPVEDRAELATVLEAFADDLELASFGGAELLDEAPEQPVLTVLDRIGSGLAATRTLTAAQTGIRETNLRIRLIGRCPDALPAGCSCTLLDGIAQPPLPSPAVRSALWPLVHGRCVAAQPAERERVREQLRACIRTPDSAASLVVDPMDIREDHDAERVRQAARRVQRRLALAGNRYQRARPFVAALTAEASPASARLPVAGACIWVLPRLSRLAGAPLGDEVERCLTPGQQR